MKQVAIAFGLLITALLVLFRVAQSQLIVRDISSGWVIGFFSVLFLAIGIVLNRKLFSQTVIFTEQKPAVLNDEKLLATGLSKREAEILLLIHDGLSNQQIADKLFISEHTVKKHVSNIFLKLNVERRTEAVKRAKELSVIS